MKKHLSFLLALFFPLAATTLFAQEAMQKALSIAEAKLGKDIKDRQIVNEDSIFAVNDRVYLWMKVTGGSADSLSVTWKTGDQTYSSKLYVGGSPWRTWAYKTAYTAGDWSVAISDAEGNSLKEISFKVTEAVK